LRFVDDYDDGEFIWFQRNQPFAYDAEVQPLTVPCPYRPLEPVILCRALNWNNLAYQTCLQGQGCTGYRRLLDGNFNLFYLNTASAINITIPSTSDVLVEIFIEPIPASFSIVVGVQDCTILDTEYTNVMLARCLFDDITKISIIDLQPTVPIDGKFFREVRVFQAWDEARVPGYFDYS
jgi:hypothetical protein